MALSPAKTLTFFRSAKGLKNDDKKIIFSKVFLKGSYYIRNAKNSKPQKPCKMGVFNLMVISEIADRFLDGWGYFEGIKPVFMEVMD